MNSRQQQLYAALGAACLLAGCGPATPPAADARQGTDTAPSATDGAAAAAAAGPKKCQEWLEVMDSDDPHLRQDARVRISGPTEDGDYRIKAMLNPPGKHDWVSKDDEAQLDDPIQKIFYAEVDVKGGGPEHDEVNTHLYRITVTEFNNGCPSKVMLHTDKHPSASGGDHGGDAELD